MWFIDTAAVYVLRLSPLQGVAGSRCQDRGRTACVASVGQPLCPTHPLPRSRSEGPQNEVCTVAISGAVELGIDMDREREI